MSIGRCVQGTGTVPAWAGLMPVTIVTMGAPSQPVERMMGLQSAVYRFIVRFGNLLSRIATGPDQDAEGSATMGQVLKGTSQVIQGG